MGNNLERHIAVVCADSGVESAFEIKDLIQSFGASASVFPLSKIRDLQAKDFDALLFVQISADRLIGTAGQTSLGSARSIGPRDPSTNSLSSEFQSIDKLVRGMNTDFKPIAAIGASISIMIAIFGPHASGGVEVATVEHSTAADDYISDRDHKVITTLGSPAGIRKMLRELVEMA